MYRFDIRRAGRVAAIGALLLSGACGGDGATGPGGGGGGNLEGNYQLVGINNTGVPAVAQMEGCSPSRFDGGTLSLGDGEWRFDIQFADETGTHFLRDEGDFEREGSELAFESATYGDQFWGELEDGLVVLYYDFCSNGEADVDFVFEG
jgi:hypothetical protein